MTGPLDGVRIIEMAGLGPAPFAGMVLSDLGAQVLRIHPRSDRGDLPSINTRFDVLARGRDAVRIDLKDPRGRGLLEDLAAGADALIEGFRPGVMERLGLGPDVLCTRNPRLVYGRMTGWGQTGPLADRAGHDINYIALSGVLDAIGEAGRAPVPPLNLLGDFGGGGMLLATGVLAALVEAGRSGRGQVVDAAMVDGAALLSAMIWGLRAAGAWGGGRGGNFLDGGAHYYATYACADGRHVAVGAIEPQFRAALYAGLGLTPGSAAEEEDPAQWPRLRDRIAAVFRTRPRDAWAARFEGTDACVTPVLDWDEATAHPHNVARGTFVAGDRLTQPRPAPRFSRTPSRMPDPAGTPFAPDPAVLGRWGIAAERIDALREGGVI
ncbi:MAG: CaiB/BaiF CoA transferase family protein [Gemmobacter sp.]